MILVGYSVGRLVGGVFSGEVVELLCFCGEFV